MKIINLQKFEVTVFPTDDREPVTFPPEGPVQVRMKIHDQSDTGLIRTGHWTHTHSLPQPTEGTMFIVGAMVAQFELFQNERTDLLFPWGLIRDDNNGRVIGCRSLCRAVRA